MSLLSNLAAYCEARGDYPAAQAYARQQIALEPWSEEAHRTLMRVLTLDGQRSAALRQYYTCRDLLRDEWASSRRRRRSRCTRRYARGYW